MGKFNILSKTTSLLLAVLSFVFTAEAGILTGNHFSDNLPPVAITVQPENNTVCAGETVTFKVVPSSPSGLSYQWYRGSTPLSGETGSTLTISSVGPEDAAPDYYVVISDGTDNTVSDFAELVVTDATAAPSSGVSGLTSASVGNTSVLGKFNAVADADYYVVFRADDGTPAPVPADGTLYTEDAEVIIGGNTYFVEYTGPDTTFVSAALNPDSDYDYWVFAYNEGICSTTPVYNTTAAKLSVTTDPSNAACPSVDTLYWAGQGSTLLNKPTGTDFNDPGNWSTDENNYLNLNSDFPNGCTNVIIELTGAVDIALSSDIETGSLTLTNTSGSAAKLLTNGHELTIYGNAKVIAANAGNISLGENSMTSGTIDFKANVELQRNSGASGIAELLGASGGTLTFRGSLIFGPGSKLDNNPTNVVFNGLGQNVVYNNSGNNIKFNNLTISGNSYLTLRGSKVQDDISGNLTVQNNGVLRMPKGTQLNKSSYGGVFAMSNNARLLIEGDQSILNPSLDFYHSLGTDLIPEGSNFPAGFSQNFQDESTVIYNCRAGESQNIFSSSASFYRNVQLQRIGGSGPCKLTNITHLAVIPTVINRNLIVRKGVKLVLYTDLSMSSSTGTGTFNIKPKAIILPKDKIISLPLLNQFTLEDSATIVLESPSGLNGSFNLSTGGSLSLSPGAFYIYNGNTNQNVGNGLPLGANIIIDNPGTVSLPTGTQNYQPASLKLIKGTLSLGNNTLTVNNFSRNAGRLGGSDRAGLVVNNPDFPLYFAQSGKLKYLKNLTLNEDATGYLIQQLSDTVYITGGLNATGQAGHVKLNQNSKLITTGGNLTLRSNQYGTASLAKVEGTGVDMGQIDGPVIVERYINAGVDGGLDQHGKAWLFLATPAEGQSIKESWMENGSMPTGYGIMLSGHAGGDWDMVSYAPAIKSYNPATNLWKGAISADEPLYNENGWMTFVRGDRTKTDPNDVANNTVLRSKGVLKIGEVVLTVEAREDGFMAFGNPYASAIDLRQVTSHGNLGNEAHPTYYLWNPNYPGLYDLGAYQSFTYDGTNFISTTGDTVNNYLLSGQAFFVQSFDDPYTITVGESDKGDTTANREYFRPGSFDQHTVARFSTDLYRVGGNIIDGTLQFFGKDFSDDVNLDDGRKMFNSGINLSIGVKDYQLAVERRPLIRVQDTIPFSLSGVTNGSYQFVFKTSNLNGPGMKAWLEDAYTGDRTPVDLDGKTEVVFEVNANNASKAADRFRIVFKAEPEDGNSLSIDAEEDNEYVNVNWSADREDGIVKYVVMASSDGVTFKDIEEQDATGSSRYAIVDRHPVAGYNHYRVRAINIYGFESYSGIAEVFVGPKEASLKVFPNPIVDNTIQLHFRNYAAGKYIIRLISPAGQTLLRQEFNHPGGNYTQSVPWPGGQAKGIYRLEVRQPDGKVKIVAIKH